jgi:hypothetical protein
MMTEYPDFSALSRSQLLVYCQELYSLEGISAFSYEKLASKGTLYSNLYLNKLGQKALLSTLDLSDEYKKYKQTAPIMRGGKEVAPWSWERVLAVARDVAERENRLPTAGWFQANGHASFVQAVYYLGKSWADLRGALKDFSNSNFVESRNGIRWLSHAEASLSNYLYARGIEHRKGGRYPDSYAEFSGYRFGIFDLTFLSRDSRWIDVEVWGDKPKGHDEEGYGKKRSAKEDFNKQNAAFIGIGYQDCYDEERLTDILELHIGRIDPFRFDKVTDGLIHTTHWSNADELLEYAAQLAATMPDGKFPTEEWLRKRGKWASREGEAYNTLSIYIKQWIGGVRKLRMLLGQEELSTTQWTAKRAIQAYAEFYDKHGMTTSQARQRYTKHGGVSYETYLEAARVESAVQKYAGGAKAVREDLAIATTRNWKWTPEVVLKRTKLIIATYGLSPTQLLGDHRNGHIVLPESDRKEIGQIIDAANRHCGGMKAILAEIGYKRASRYRVQKR